MTNSLQVRRSERGRILLTKYPELDFILFTEEGVLESFYEAISHKNKQMATSNVCWDGFYGKKNHTYELIKLPNGIQER